MRSLFSDRIRVSLHARMIKLAFLMAEDIPVSVRILAFKARDAIKVQE